MLDTPAEIVVTPSAQLSPADLQRCLTDWWWRITSGKIYKIKAKTAEGVPDAVGLAIPFIPNESQMLLLADLHNKNIVLKARQQGFSTLIEIMALDHALFNADQNVVVIAHNQTAAQKLFADKVKYAYDRLPDQLRALFPLKKNNESQLEFSHNNSMIEVVSSARSGTVHFLHVSEMGKIAAEFPAKARELTTGSLQAVPQDGFLFIESTAEGQDGAFYELARRAEAKRKQRKVLSPADYNFFFSPWYISNEYRIDPDLVVISPTDHEYFDLIEDVMSVSIDMAQRAWYVAKRDEEFAHEPDLMWREYPSTPEECWKSSTEGKYLVKVMARARAEGRIGVVPHRPGLPVNSFWDIGASDDTVCWLHQRVNNNDHWIKYRESSGEGYLPHILWMEEFGYAWGTHYLPHDAAHSIKGIEQVTTTISQLRKLRPTWDWQIVPVVKNIQHGIDLLRIDFATYWFDEVSTKEGLAHLDNYKRQWMTRQQTWGNQPEHDEHSHCADAIRQKAQGYRPAGNSTLPPRDESRRSGRLL